MVEPGETCKLRYRWNGEPSEHPRNGDVLKTRTGRRYLILCARGRRIEAGSEAFGAKYGMRGVVTELLGPMILEVLVMQPDDPLPEGAREFDFAWDHRRKKR